MEQHQHKVLPEASGRLRLPCVGQNNRKMLMAPFRNLQIKLLKDKFLFNPTDFKQLLRVLQSNQ